MSKLTECPPAVNVALDDDERGLFNRYHETFGTSWSSIARLSLTNGVQHVKDMLDVFHDGLSKKKANRAKLDADRLSGK